MAVSIHTPTKGVTPAAIDKYLEALFQSTHPRRVWLICGVCPSFCTHVSIHTPTKGVTNVCTQHDGAWYVSIHTPTKGVTLGLLRIEEDSKVSIHTPTKGVTFSGSLTAADSSLFQSTHPRRVWHLLTLIRKIVTKVSIHTPTKGVTVSYLWLCSTLCGFNPHTHEGCDWKS